MNRLGDYCDVFSGYAFKAEDLKVEGDIPVVKIGNISNGHGIILDENTQYVDMSFMSINKKYHISKGDILISLTGSHINQPNSMVGRCCRHLEQAVYLLNQRAGKIIPKDSVVKDFIYYLFQLNAIKYSVANLAYGGANQVNVSPKDILRIKWEIPSVSVQKTISSILSPFDIQIENNLKRIKLLEQVANNLYKEWFVRFRFPGYESVEFYHGIPQGWRYESLNENQYCSVLPSGIKDFDGEKTYLATADVDGMRVVSHDTKITLENRPSRANMQPVANSVWFAKMKDSRKLLLVDQDMTDLIDSTILSTGFTGLKVDTSALYYVFCFLLSKQFDDTKNMFANGSTQQALNNDRIRRIKLLIPDYRLVKQFNEIAHPIFSQIYSLEQQIKLLTNQRDLLLPRLMSGKLSI